MDPTIVFCTTCKGRAYHVDQTLPKNIADNADYDNCKFILLDYNDAGDLEVYLKEKQQAAIASGKLVVYTFRQPVQFNMAHAKNMAHRVGILEGGDILVNLDADNYTGVGFATFVAKKFEEDANSLLWASMIKGLMPRGVSGRIAVSRHAFLNVGGYDERFNTWSPDDKDFNLRLRRIGYVPYEIDAIYLDAIKHNDKIRFKEYKYVSSGPMGEEGSETVDSSSKTVVNFGRFGMGTVYRNFDWEHPIELKPVPTRIFGIGMHKTGTTSLHHALQVLGIDSAHWVTAHWAKAIWEEMQTGDKSKTLEHSYALSDLPIPLLFKRLDRFYPGSKFILTYRHEWRWLNSVRNHWDPESNPFRNAWSTDPFTHKIHKEVYGQKGFDPVLFLQRYQNHNFEVRTYFRDRPDDLLDMNMEQASWEPLCKFLDKPVPDIPYPVAFPTRPKA